MMKLQLDSSQPPQCAMNNCPARIPVIGSPGGTVYIGKKLEQMDPEAYAEVRSRIGPDEDAYWVPDGL